MKRRVPTRAFDELSSLPSLWAAWHRARKGKRRTLPAARFDIDAERHLLGLHRSLRGGYYRPRPFRVRVIRDPKIRAIVLADFADRVLHQAIHGVVAPWFERSHIENTYACLPGRGTHRAVLRYLRLSRQRRFRLSLDVRRYFLSIDHDRLLELLFERIHEGRLRSLLERTVRVASGLYRHPRLLAQVPGLAKDPIPDGVGLPIGTLTSQWCANFYLSGLDHFILRELKIGTYQRYMDDLTLFSNDEGELVSARKANTGSRARMNRAHPTPLARARCALRLPITEFAAVHRRLEIHPDAEISSTRVSSVYLGFEVTQSGLKMGPKAKRRLRGNLRRAARKGPEAVYATLMAYRGIALFG